MVHSRAFWEQRSLHPVARTLLVAAVGVLLCIAAGFITASGTFTRLDLLAVAFYAGLAAFAWHPMTAASIVMIIGSVGVLFTGSGGDLLELALATSLVAAACSAWVIVAHVTLLGVLTAYIASTTTTLASGGAFGIAGIAVIALLAGAAFRLLAAREAVSISERARVTRDLESLAREDRERIADELHDGIAHDLTLILFHARALPLQPDEIARQVSLTTIEDSSQRALHSIHSLLALMRNPMTEAPGQHPVRFNGDILEAVVSLGALLRDAGIPTKVSSPGIALGVPPAAERILTETAIEAVTNIIKHSPKSLSATIEIRDQGGLVELIVRNAGPFGTTGRPSPGGRGLDRARQRLIQSKGRLEVGRVADEWVLRAVVNSHEEAPLRLDRPTTLEE